MRLYPLVFTPLLKEKIWGGDKLKKEFNKASLFSHAGESWELSCIEGEVSVVADGPLKGRDLRSLLRESGPDIMGKKVFAAYGPEFPLLFKFIDAAQDLSVQVHPGDELAQARHGSRGKTEMWYVLSAEPGALLLSGFRKAVKKKDYPRLAASGEIMDALASYPVKSGDVFFIPAGRVHAIGGGIVLAEVQQTSDITYRIFDYNRRGADDKPRILHTELAADAIDFTVQSDYRTHYHALKNEAVKIAECPFFTVNLISISSSVRRVLKDRDSFIVYMCADGAARLSCCADITELKKGDTVLVPACLADIVLSVSDPSSTSGAKILEIYV
jgi:mannose-6-phosphate isomerase